MADLPIVDFSDRDMATAFLRDRVTFTAEMVIMICDAIDCPPGGEMGPTLKRLVAMARAQKEKKK